MKEKVNTKLRLLLTLALFMTFITCDTDNDIQPVDVGQDVTAIDSLPIKGGLKFIPSAELPDAFKSEIFNSFSNQKSTMLKGVSEQQLLNTYFGPEASVIESKNGIITYALPIKKSVKYSVALKEGAFKKQLITEVCPDDDPFEILAINFDGSDINSHNGMTYISITSGVNPDSFYTTFTNPNTGISESTQTFINNHLNNFNETASNGVSTGAGGLGSIFSAIWQGISWAGNGLINLFQTDRCGCAVNSGSKTAVQSKNQSSNRDVEACCNSNYGGKSTANKEGNNIFDHVAFQFYFPIPDYLFEEQSDVPKQQLGKSSGDETDCECKLEDINIDFADESIKQDFFDCACANDNPVGIASYLNLSLAEYDWLSQPENKTKREAICKFTKDNNYSVEALAFDKLATQALMNGGEVDFVEQVILDKEFINNPCLKGVYDDMGKATKFKEYLQNFEASASVADLRFTADDNFSLNPENEDYLNAMAITNPPLISNEVVITFNTDPNTTGNILDKPDVFKAVAMIHELLHAEMYRKMLDALQTADNNQTTLDWANDWSAQEFQQFVESLENKYFGIFDFYTRYDWNTSTPSGAQHQQMASYYRNIIKQALADYDPTLTESQKETLSWLGLNGANIVAWQNLTPTERTSINSTISQIQNTFPNGCN